MSILRRLRRLLAGLPNGGQGGGGEGSGGGQGEPISCQEALARVHEYLDGELDETSHRQVAHHFAVCQRCYPHLRLEERFREFLHHHAGQEERAPDHLKEKVLELLASEGERED